MNSNQAYFAEVESRTQGSRPRAQKNPRPKTDLSRTGMLEAKAKDTTRKCSPKEKKRSLQKNCKFSTKFRRSPKNVSAQKIANFSRNSGVLSKKNKKKRSLKIFRKVSGVF